MSERKEALRKARERYNIDYKGILLNTGVSVLSSATATGVTSAITTIPMSQLPVVAFAIFVAQILPKLVIELNKAYFRNKARREGYKEGLLNDDFSEKSEKAKATAFNTFISLCEHASYFP